MFCTIREITIIPLDANMFEQYVWIRKSNRSLIRQHNPHTPLVQVLSELGTPMPKTFGASNVKIDLKFSKHKALFDYSKMYKLIQVEFFREKNGSKMYSFATSITLLVRIDEIWTSNGWIIHESGCWISVSLGSVCDVTHYENDVKK